MKKFIILTIAMCSIILTSCGNKRIICKGTIGDNGINTKVIVTGKFSNSKLSNQETEMNFDLTEYLQYADIDSYYEMFITEYDKFKNYDGIYVEINKEGNSIIVNLNIDLEKVDEQSYKDLGIGNGMLEVSTKAFIKEFTNMGFTCK